jgi:hypothetical protein
MKILLRVSVYQSIVVRRVVMLLSRSIIHHIQPCSLSPVATVLPPRCKGPAGVLPIFKKYSSSSLSVH